MYSQGGLLAGATGEAEVQRIDAISDEGLQPPPSGVSGVSASPNTTSSTMSMACFIRRNTASALQTACRKEVAHIPAVKDAVNFW